MRSSARSARRSTRGSPSSAASAWSTASIAISISPSPGRRLDQAGALKTLAPPREAAGNVVAVDFGAPAGEVSREPVEAEVDEHINLNSSRSDKETVHLALAFDGAAPAYEPGDFARHLSRERSALVDAVLAAAGLNGRRRAARRVPQASATSPRLSLKTPRDLCGRDRPSTVVRSCSQRRRARTWIEGRQLIDLIEAYPGRAHRRAAAGRDAAAAAARLLDRVLAQGGRRRGASARRGGALRAHGRARKGVASTHVADRLKPARPCAVGLKPNKHFRLPAADATSSWSAPAPASRRSAPSCRSAAPPAPRAATGCSSATAATRTTSSTSSNGRTRSKDGALTRLDLAFSRDTPEKVYVQHRLWERAATGRLAGGRRALLRLRRRQGDGQGRARRAGARLRGREGAVAGGRRSRRRGLLERDRRYLQDVY